MSKILKLLLDSPQIMSKNKRLHMRTLRWSNLLKETFTQYTTSAELLDHLLFCHEQDIVFTKFPGGKSNTLRKMCPRRDARTLETASERVGVASREGDKGVLRGSDGDGVDPSPSSKLHSQQAVSDYPHAEARIRLDRRNFAISLFSRARIEESLKSLRPVPRGDERVSVDAMHFTIGWYQEGVYSA